jgi:hypothetical protein
MGQDLADSLAYLNAQDASNYAALAAAIANKNVKNYLVSNRGSYSSPTNELVYTYGDFERIVLAQPASSPWNWPALQADDITVFHVGIQFNWRDPASLGWNWMDSELRVYLSNGDVSPAHSLSHVGSWTAGSGYAESRAGYSSLLWVNRVVTPHATPTFDLKCHNQTVAGTLCILGYDVTALLIRGM